MFIRTLIAITLIVGLAGCATTSRPRTGDADQLQSRLTELEKKLEEKDAEIVDLQYEVKDLSSKLGSERVDDRGDEESVSYSTPTPKVSSDEIIRVNVSPEKVQTALKNAGYYTGKIDGKVGSGTKAAIVQFQKAQGLKADGILGKKTWEELKTYLK